MEKVIEKMQKSYHKLLKYMENVTLEKEEDLFIGNNLKKTRAIFPKIIRSNPEKILRKTKRNHTVHSLYSFKNSKNKEKTSENYIKIQFLETSLQGLKNSNEQLQKKLLAKKLEKKSFKELYYNLESQNLRVYQNEKSK